MEFYNSHVNSSICFGLAITCKAAAIPERAVCPARLRHGNGNGGRCTSGAARLAAASSVPSRRSTSLITIRFEFRLSSTLRRCQIVDAKPGPPIPQDEMKLGPAR
ncbi:hypothetical protein ABZP36_019797 [Zizania latifolia]